MKKRERGRERKKEGKKEKEPIKPHISAPSIGILKRPKLFTVTILKRRF